MALNFFSTFMVMWEPSYFRTFSGDGHGLWCGIALQIFFFLSSYFMSICNPLGYDRRAPWPKRTYIILPGLEPLILLPFLRFLAAILLAAFEFPLLSLSKSFKPASYFVPQSSARVVEGFGQCYYKSLPPFQSTGVFFCNSLSLKHSVVVAQMRPRVHVSRARPNPSLFQLAFVQESLTSTYVVISVLVGTVRRNQPS